MKNVLIVATIFIVVTILTFKLVNRSTELAHNTESTTSAGKIIAGSFDKNKFRSEREWKKILTPAQYIVLRQQGTETPYTGDLLHNKRKGTYLSVGCEKPVFSSAQKYDSNTGWPSFWAPIDPEAVVLREDNAHGMERIEVLDTCGNHIGHVFDDGPEPTGKRYCINSIALKFIPD